MLKKIIKITVIMCLVFSLTACGCTSSKKKNVAKEDTQETSKKTEKDTTSKETVSDKKEESTKVPESTETQNTQETTKVSGNTASQETQETKKSEEIKTPETTKTENTNNSNTNNSNTNNSNTMVSDKNQKVFVNGIEYNKGVTLELVTTLKANDTQFKSCCPSYNIKIEGVKNMQVYYNSIEMSSYYGINPLIINTRDDSREVDGHVSYWTLFNILAPSEDATAVPIDITKGIHIASPRVTLKEAGNYTISVTSGNGDTSLLDEFKKYDNCFSMEIKEVK